MIRFLAAFVLTFALFACGGTEIDKNPAPIAWGQLTFKAETVEKSKDKTVYNNIAFSGYGKQGTIERVIIEGDRATVENLKSDFYSSPRQVFVKPGGDYKAAVEVLVALVGGGDASSARSGLRTLPSLGGYEGDNIALTTPVGKLAAASLKARDLAPITAKDLEVESLAIETGDGEKISVAEGSFGVFSMPVTPPDPEKAALENLKIKDIQITERDGSCSAASVEAKELALNAARDAAVTKLAVSPSRGPSISVAEASVARLFIPENVENQPQKAIVEKLRIRDISAPQLGAKVEKADLDMGADSVSLLIDKASIPGAILKDFDIPTAPATIEGSLDAEGKIKNNILTAKAALILKDLFNLGADIVGNIDDREPEKVNFVLRETGIFKYITQEQRARLAFLSLFVPGAQEALVGFLSRPGQTLSGSVTFEGRQPDFKFELN